MSERFNRKNESDSIKEDRLFPDDFIDDQDGQDQDLLQLAADFGCVPCIGSGLVVTALDPPSNNKVQVSDGWAYDKDGRRISVGVPQNVTLDYPGGDNFIVIYYDYVESESRPAHRTGTVYPTRISDWFEIKVLSANPGEEDKGIVLAKCTKQTEPEAIIVEITERVAPSCRLVAQSMIEVKTTGPRKGPPPGQKPELPDYPLGRDIPMPIILSGTRNGSAWNGIETILPEVLGITDTATNMLTLERVNLKSGTPVADVKVWIGDWGTGQRSGTQGQENRCVFDMNKIASGVDTWDTNLWKTDPPGYYYLVRDDESWFSKITASDGNSVTCADNLPDADSHTFYICPYAEKYRGQAFPYVQVDPETEQLVLTYPYTIDQVGRVASPVAPVVIIKELNLGGKYEIKVASVVSGDNYTNWAKADFIVGQDLRVCWEPATDYLTVTPVDGGVEVAIPAPSGTTEAPEAYELCYTYGKDAASVPLPNFDDPTHSTIRTSEQLVKLDIPPGYVVKLAGRAIIHRIVMQCTGENKILTPDYTTVGNIVAGGVSLRRNRKAFTNPINETSLAAGAYILADQQKLPNPIWPESIALFNPTDEVKTDFEVYIHGSNQDYLAGRKIQINNLQGNDATQIGARGWVQKTITDFRITDPAMMVTVFNTHTADPLTLNLRYTVQYYEDTAGETTS
ncbi:MAG: hypothetical protein U9Q76_06960 [candidate division WOR-3 bacterium]|nr:hypothetical protein [candidate division WOR-3 bacterium]